jgi:hypothetical protein
MIYNNVVTGEEFYNLLQKDPPFLIQYMLEIAQASRECPDDALIIPFNFIPKEPPSNLLLRQFGHLFTSVNSYDKEIVGFCRTRALPSWETVLETINDWAPQIKKLSFDNYVAAGSFPILACRTFYDILRVPSDIDFYPYYNRNDLINHNVQDTIIVPYKKFLSDVEESCESDMIITTRNENCTTIETTKNDVSRFQMIHRAHPSAKSVIVGFDQMACKAFFDGKMIYFTIDAALCLYFGINPVDWRRESPNHLARTEKYISYGYAPIYPGLSFELGVDLVNGRIMGKQDYYRLPNIMLYITELSEHDFIGQIYDVSLDSYDEPPNKEIDQSDYEDDMLSVEILGIWYRAISMMINGKQNPFTVFSNLPTNIINKSQLPDIRKVIEKLAGGSRSHFYLGDARTRDINRKLISLTCKSETFGLKSVKAKCMSLDDVQEFVKLQQQYREIIEERIIKLEAMVTNQHRKLATEITFKISNPGAQFTSSFRPIRREKPEDYWGPAYKPFDYTKFQRIKFTILCIRRFSSHLIKSFDISLIKLLFKYLYIAHFIDLAINSDNLIASKRISETFIMHSIKGISSRFPWHDSEP